MINQMFEYSWDIDPVDSMIMIIKHNDEVVMRVFVGEIMESAGGTAVIEHVNECNRSPWIKSWHDTMWVALKDPRGMHVKE